MRGVHHRPRARAATCRWVTLLVTLGLAACSGPVEAPEEAPWPVSGREGVVAAAHPDAVRAGLDVLAAGGSAVDAAVAVQFVLGLVEAPETGPGGGGFLLHYHAASGQLEVFDGRETAPAGASVEAFTWFGGRPLPHALAVISGRAVGVPGLVAMLGEAHGAHGRLPWPELLAPAITLAEQGYPPAPRLRRQLRADPSLWVFPDLRAHFFRWPWRPANTLQDPQATATLRTLAEHGPAAFYQGEIAGTIAARATAGAWRTGRLTPEDLAGYRVETREALCGQYREWRVCGAPPPSSGGLAVLQVLGMLEHFPMAELADQRAEAIHLIAEASRLAFADRAAWVGDPEFVEVPVAHLLAPDYLAQRAALIERTRARPAVAHGHDIDAGGTSHFTIIDAAGNIAAVTSSIEAPFGSRRRAAGFLLNNQLTDFDFIAPEDPALADHAPVNLPAPGKRPRSSMSPIIVFAADDTPVLAFGARGGSRIIGHLVRVLIAVLDWELSLEEAFAEGNFLHRGEHLELERGSPADTEADRLRGYGHTLRRARMPSGLHGIERAPDGWRGAADPRHDGAARALGDGIMMTP